MKPTRIELINRVLAIAWEDGRESYFDLATLRRACPCATCQGESNVLSVSPPAPANRTHASFKLRQWQYVGGYAIQPTWADGHAAGIYSFEYLRRLSLSGL